MTEIINGVTYTVINCNDYDTYKNQIGNYDSVTGIDYVGSETNGVGSDSTLPNTANKLRFTKSVWILHGSPDNVLIRNFGVLASGCFKDTTVKKVYIGNTVRNGVFPSINALGSKCFENATSLNSVIFEDYDPAANNNTFRYISVDAFAFRYTSALTTLTFPKRLWTLEGSALKSATGLTSLIFDGISNNITDLNNYMIVDIGGASTEFIIVKNNISWI